MGRDGGHRRAAWLAALWLVAGPVAAHAGPREDAARALDDGVAHYRKGDHAGALDRFHRAYVIFPSPKILFNAALALEALGRDAEAAQAYELYLAATGSAAGASDRRARTARAALNRIGARVGRLQFPPGLDGASISIDGTPLVLPAHRAVYVRPGRHLVVIAFPGMVRYRFTTSVAAGKQRSVAAGLAPPPGFAPRQPIPPRRWTFTMVTAGVAIGLAGGGVVAHIASSATARDSRSLEDDAERDRKRAAAADQARISRILFAGAGAAAVASGILFFVEGRTAGVTLSPSAGGGLALSIGGNL